MSPVTNEDVDEEQEEDDEEEDEDGEEEVEDNGLEGFEVAELPEIRLRPLPSEI